MSPHWLRTLGKSQVFCDHSHPLPFACAACHKSGVCKFPALTRWRARRGCVAHAVCQRCYSAEVIVICIQRDGSAPKPCSLNKHLGLICVHLDLLFYGLHRSTSHSVWVLQAIPNSDSSSLWHPLFKQIKQFFVIFSRIQGTFGFIRLENHIFFLPLCFLSTYLPETPSLGAGRHGLHQAWVNISQVSAQICIFTLPATTAGCTCGTLYAVTHADESVSSLGLS